MGDGEDLRKALREIISKWRPLPEYRQGWVTDWVAVSNNMWATLDDIVSIAECALDEKRGEGVCPQ